MGPFWMSNFKIISNRDFICVIGDNGSGKTTLVEKLILSKVPRDKVYVLNSSLEDSWNKYVAPKNITKPIIYTQQYFEKFLLDFTANHIDCTLVLDDIDNYEIKKSWVLKSIVTNARHLNIGIILTSRNLQDIPKVLYRQSKYIFVSRQVSMYDRQYIATIIGLEKSYTLANLGEHVFGMYDGVTKNMEYIKLKV